MGDAGHRPAAMAMGTFLLFSPVPPVPPLSPFRLPPQLSLEVGVVQRGNWSTEVLPGPGQHCHSHCEKEPAGYSLASLSRYQMDKANQGECQR